MSVVENDQARLADVVDKNSETFSDSLKLLESMGFVMQRVMNDMLSGRVRCVGDTYHEGTDVPVRQQGVTPQIDFHSYLVEFWACQVFAEFVAWLASRQKPEENKIVTPTQNDVVVFGGD